MIVGLVGVLGPGLSVPTGTGGAPVIEPPVNVAIPLVDGTTVEGSSLTVSNGVWQNSPEAFAYQWLRDGADIPGATSAIYMLTSSDVGAMISCRVTATNAGGSTPATSNAVGPIEAALQPPVNTSPPTISGSVEEGALLEALVGTWTNDPDTFSFQWNRGGAPIIGATSNSYTTGAEDVGELITVTVTATNAAGSSAPETSAPFGPIEAPAAPPVNTTPPAIAGDATVGQVLTVTPGTWDNSPTSITRQWRRDGSPITGATGLTYTLVEADEGASIDCLETATNAAGSVGAPSNALGPVAPAPPQFYFYEDFAITLSGDPPVQTNPPDGTEINGRVPSVVPGTGAWANGTTGFNGLVTFVGGNMVRGQFGGSSSLARMDGQAVPAGGATLSLEGSNNSATLNNAALVLRFNDDADFYRIIARLNPATIILQKRVGGVTTDMASIANADAIINELYWLSLSVRVLEDRVQLHIYSQGVFKHEEEDAAVDRITSFTTSAVEVATNARLAKVTMTAPDTPPITPPDPEPGPPPYVGIYVGPNPGTALPEAEAWLGKQVDSVPAHGDNRDWTWWENSATYLVNTFGPINRKKTFSVPLIPHNAIGELGPGPNSNLADAAAGLYNDRYIAYATILANRFANDPLQEGIMHVRTGEEFNGDWFPWAANGLTDEYIGAYQQFVNCFRSVTGGDKFRFEWCPAIGNLGMNPETAYPGDLYVDVIGMDFYWDLRFDPTDPYAAWSYMVGRSYGLQWHQNFAAAHSKPTAYSEWGIQSNAAGPYIQRAAQWFNDHDILYQNYWDSNSVFTGKLSDGQYPDAGAVFIATFNPTP